MMDTLDETLGTAGLPRFQSVGFGPRAVVLCLFALVLGCARPVVLHTSDGGTIPLTAHTGHWVLVNYWAEWCEPCRREIPELNAIDKARAPDVAVYGVNYDGVSGAELQTLAKKMGIAFPLLAVDPGAELGIAHPEVLPTTIVIAPSGRRTVLVGPQTQATLTAAFASAD